MSEALSEARMPQGCSFEMLDPNGAEVKARGKNSEDIR
jgi:hypothetical protein